MTVKICTKCGIEKQIDLFYNSKENVSSSCKTCFLSSYRKRKILANITYLEGENFKCILGCEFDYHVSLFGRIKSLNYNNTNQAKILKNNLQKTGYLSVGLKINGKRKTISVHRLVAMSFIPNPDDKPYVNHINGIKTDNSIENLEWSTAKENTDHGIKLGLINGIKGEKNCFSMLSNSDVLEIRKIHENCKITYRETAKKYNVTGENISMIVKRKTWTHI